MDIEKIIFVADRSYTIRRIIEMAFSEKGNIQIHLFDNGKELQEALLKTQPDAVIVDIKLPEISGYDICRFINEQNFAKKIKIFLLKGSFEPIENETIKTLRFEELITKPFDSSALVNIIMKSLEEEIVQQVISDEVPESFPEEELAEIDTSAPETGISFESLKEELEKIDLKKEETKEDVLPSEEITVGSIPDSDSLAPENEAEPNPFSEENVAAEQEAEAEEPALKIEAEPLNETEETEFDQEGEEEISQISMEETTESEEDSKLDLFQKEELEIEKENLFSEIEINKPLSAEAAEIKETEEFTAQPEAQVAEPEISEEIIPEAETEKEEKIESIPQSLIKEEKIDLEASRLVSTQKIEQEAETEKLSLNMKEKEELIKKVEDRLTLAIKEILWEVVPGLAEKIIKQEIAEIKKEIDLG